MSITLHLPNREETLAFHRQRWAEVLADPQWADHPYRIETDAFGRIVMTPPAGGSHSGRQRNVQNQLERCLGGRALPECPISTADGVRAVDVGWYSDQRYASVRGQLAFETAPEICVEVMSPSNTAAEMQTKRILCFDAGAIECWVCDLDGRMTQYHHDQPDEPVTTSSLCPKFPNQIEDW